MFSLKIKGPRRVDVQGLISRSTRSAMSAVENSPEVQAVAERRRAEGVPEDELGEDPQVAAVVTRVAERAAQKALR